jgi:hypothetical protein
MPREPHAFTAPLGLGVFPVTRAHVRLLGPCFKTGRESTRSGSAADWSGLCPRTPGTNSLTGVRGRDESHATPGIVPRRACPDGSDARSLARERDEVAGLYPP